MFHALVVDDHTGFRDSICAVLRKNFPQINVDEARNAREALRSVRDCVTDLVLLDIKMPDGNGIELTKLIKTTYASITVIIVTVYDLPQYRQAAVRNGADCFIYKGSKSCMNDILARVEGAILAQRA